MIQYRRHQARGPHFAVADDFSIYRIGDAAIQQARQTFKIVNKRRDQRVSGVRRQQAGDQIHLIATQRLLHLMRRKTIGLA